jgi:hypothetical protein
MLTSRSPSYYLIAYECALEQQLVNLDTCSTTPAS